MTTPRYRVISYAAAEGYSGYHQDQLDWYRYNSVIVDDVTKEILASDGGEPEDQTFGRDLRWIAPALNDAYAKGYMDGSADESEQRDP